VCLPTYLGLDALGVGNELEDFGLRLLEGWGSYVSQHDAGALLGEEDGCLEADTTVECQRWLFKGAM